jgi:formate dehydrogenase major subunit
MADGPMPEHYEPMESPMVNLMSSQQSNPALDRPGKVDKSGVFYIATTCRVSEHWQAGAMTRNLPWLVELVPDMFVEMSGELAKSKGIQRRFVTIVSRRGSIRPGTVASGSNRFNIGGK